MMRPLLRERDQLLLLPCLAYLGTVLLHVDRSPLWCSLVATLALLWRGAVALYGLALPGRVLRIVLTLGLVALTVLSFRTLNGLAAGSALLIVMGALKLLETHSRRDALIITGVALFLLLAACLDRQSLPRLPLYALLTWLACASLTALGASATAFAPRAALRTAGRTLLLALPFALVVFLLFPRLPGALWALPANERATTGLNEEMSPGSISELTVSDAIAFVATFDGAAPPPAQRYWRGPVLHDFDGYTWRRRPGQLAVSQPLEMLGAPLRYRVTLEPTQQNWWFALDTVARSPSPRVMLSFDQQLLAARPVTQVVSYDAESYLQTRSTQPLSILARRIDLRLPPGRNPRTLALAQQLRVQASDDAAYAATVLDYFRRGGFQYTLTPPLLDLDSIDDLLFNTRQGFCGHFASAYATLLRAGGVPARVVTGYLGGEWNSVGGYYAVRQSEAHAWTEVWLDGRGWTRVDPTAVVAPERLQHGLRELLPDSGTAMARFLRASPLMTGMLQAWDAGNRWWQERVIGFNLRAQLALLEQLGLPDADYRQLALLLVAGCAAWLALLWWQLRTRRRPVAGDELGRAWHALRDTLSKAGMPAMAQAGPVDLAERAARQFPALGQSLRAVAGDYARLRYGSAGPGSAAVVAPVVRRIRELLPQLRRLKALDALPGLDAAALESLRLQLPVYRRMPPELRQRSSVLAREFLRRVHFEGCGGLRLTQGMRQLVAFQACLLIAHRGYSPYRGLRSVLVYPDEFVVPLLSEDESGVVTEGSDVLSGQTEDTGRILLSWADVQAGLAASASGGDAYNVVLHEFAHLLDHAVDGALSRHASLTAGHEALCAAVEAGEDTLIDPYGAEDPAEFFAVCTELFVERPRQFQSRHPELHATLREFYQMDPADWEADS